MGYYQSGLLRHWRSTRILDSKFCNTRLRQIVFCLFGCVYGVDRAESCRVVSFDLGFCFSFLVASGVAVDQLRIGLGGDRDKRLSADSAGPSHMLGGTTSGVGSAELQFVAGYHPSNINISIIMNIAQL